MNELMMLAHSLHFLFFHSDPSGSPEEITYACLPACLQNYAIRFQPISPNDKRNTTPGWNNDGVFQNSLPCASAREAGKKSG